MLFQSAKHLQAENEKLQETVHEKEKIAHDLKQ